jgi:LuxR family maltose regulon positive regulatory protein
MHVGMSDILRERNDLDAAMQHLLMSKEQGDRTGLPQNRYRWCVAMARLQQANGDLDAALVLLDDAERVYMSDFFPKVRPVAAWKARVWVAQGKLGEALGWAREQDLSPDDDLSYLREFEHITLARLLLAQRSSREALALLDRLLHAAEASGRMGSAIEILVLQALAFHMQSDFAAARVSLDRALMLAEPEGYFRVFVDEGPRIVALLGSGNAPSRYVRQLLAAVATPRRQQSLLEPLSERELEVLRLLGTDLTGPEIARELTVSLNTVRTHTRNIYAKLGVNTRLAAVRRLEHMFYDGPDAVRRDLSAL